MNALQHFFAGTFVYMAIMIFIIECFILFFRISKKYQSGQLTPGYLHPNKYNVLTVIAELIWHFSIIVLVFGHSRMIGDFNFIFNFVSYEFMNTFGHIAGCALGVFIAAVFIYFLIKRIQNKRTSAILDIVFLLCGIILITLGNILQFEQPFSLELYREYMHSILTFAPAFPESITGSYATILTLHVTIACCMLIFFPWSGVAEHMINHIYQRHINDKL